MFKKAVILTAVLLLLGMDLPAQQEEGLIKGIFFLKNPAETHIRPPLAIRIGIDMAAPTYFKLFQNDTIIKAGILLQGVNALFLPTEYYFEKTAQHTFLLELKTEQGIIRKDIVLDIQLAVLDNQQKTEDETVVSEHQLSLYIENQLVSTRLKRQETIPSLQPDLKRIHPNENPFYVPKETDNLMRNTVSIFDALGMAYQLIKSATQKKETEETSPTLEQTFAFTLKFFRTTPRGSEEEVIAMLGITTKDPPKNLSPIPRLSSEHWKDDGEILLED